MNALDRSWSFLIGFVFQNWFLCTLLMIVHDRSKVENNSKKIQKNVLGSHSATWCIRWESRKTLSSRTSLKRQLVAGAFVSFCRCQLELTTTGACQAKLAKSEPTRCAFDSAVSTSHSPSTSSSSRLCVCLHVAVSSFSPPRSRCVLTATARSTSTWNRSPSSRRRSSTTTLLQKGQVWTLVCLTRRRRYVGYADTNWLFGFVVRLLVLIGHRTH